MSAWLTPEAVSSLAGGVAATVVLTLVTTVGASIIGISVGAGRLSNSRAVRGLATAFIEVFRNIPALIQIIFWAFAFPSAFPIEIRARIFFDNPLMDWVGTVTGLSLPYYAFAACLGLTLNTGAHLSELFRAGVGTIPRNHLEAARVFACSPSRRFWTVILPGGVRGSFPAVTTRLVHNLKNTALASFVAVPELFSAIQASITSSFLAMEFLLIAAALYLALSTAAAALLGRIDHRLHNGRRRVAQH